VYSKERTLINNENESYRREGSTISLNSGKSGSRSFIALNIQNAGKVSKNSKPANKVKVDDKVRQYDEIYTVKSIIEMQQSSHFDIEPIKRPKKNNNDLNCINIDKMSRKQSGSQILQKKKG